VATFPGWQKALLAKLGAPATPQNLRFVNAWAQAEGGSASFNPFNTTQNEGGASSYNSVGVKNYSSPGQGIAATVATLLNGRYNPIVSGLRSGHDTAAQLATDVAHSPWGTGSGVLRVLGSGPVKGGAPTDVLSAVHALAGGGAAQPSTGVSPQQLMSDYLLQQAQTELGGGSQNPVAAEGTGLLQLAMARKALTASGAPMGGGATSTKGSSPTYGKASGIAGGFLPKGAKYVVGRKDQGQDGQTDPGAPILAPGSGVVISVKSDPNGFGPRYPIVHFTSGPYAGKNVYLGHTLAAVAPGQKFSAGQVLSHTGTVPIGNASVPGWFEIGFAPGGLPGPNGQIVPF
jgi:hypothetical protein